MSRVRSTRTARQIGNVTVVKDSTVAGMRQIRCPKCQGMAAPCRSSAGKDVYRCGQCGATFGSKKF